VPVGKIRHLGSTFYSGHLAIAIGVSSRPRKAAESGGQREHRRAPLRAARRYRGDHVRLMATLLGVIHCIKQCSSRPAPNHAYRENAPRLAAALQTGDRLWCLPERSSYLGHAMLITPIFICRHRACSLQSTTSIREKPGQALQNRTPRGLSRHS
jgi:hypothetical protein